MEGRAVGRVVATSGTGIPVGTPVLHRGGWREHALLAAADVTVLPDLDMPLSHHLGVLGTTGFTAWVGLSVIAPVHPGDRVFVSAAAGGVGSIAGQIARLRGATQVAGSAGSADKVAWLRDDLGFDEAINYRETAIGPALRAAMPDGCDVYFDNVGGDHLVAALDAMNDFGRVALCGSVSAYNAAEPVAMPGNLFHATRKRLTMRGFIVSDHMNLREKKFLTEMVPWVRDGKVKTRETVSDGLDSMPGAFLGMLAGANTGKSVVRLNVD
jgi:NADPH-dependent curcumin reductase CurA